MVVFDRDFLERLERVNATRPASYRSDLYFFVTSDDRRGVREWVEHTIALLPEPGRTGLTSRLRADSNFVAAINEVGVAATLLDAGLRPECEPQLGDLTPDLFVRGEDDRPPMIIEVWTRQPRSGEPSRRRGWQALAERVAKIPIGVGIILEPKTRRSGPPDRQAIAEIGRELHLWLTGGQRRAGDVYDVRGYRFRIAGPSPFAERAFMPRPNEGGVVDTNVVMDVIDRKTRRYRALAAELGAALVIVLAAQPDTPLDLEMVRATLDGRQALSFLVPPSPSGPLGEVSMQLKMHHTPPQLDPTVSAVGWVDTASDRPKLHLLDNPAAATRLPPLEAESITRERSPGV